MTHRDHFALGLLMYSGGVRLASAAGLSFAAGSGALSSFVVFLAGVSFPDMDLYIWPTRARGHRMCSPLHRLDLPLCAALLSAAAAFRLGGIAGFAAAACFNFTAGWAVHLFGDFLQGGVRLGFGYRKRVGFKKFSWDAYSGIWGLLLGLALKAAGFAAAGWLLVYWKGEFIEPYKLFAAAGLVASGAAASGSFKFFWTLCTAAVFAAAWRLYGAEAPRILTGAAIF